MADPELTPSNCAGTSCSIALGVDITSLTPNQLLAVLLRDERTIECDDVEHVRVKRCLAGPDIPYVAATTQTCGNMLRIQNGPTNAADNSDDCGLVVQAPLIETHATGGRVEVMPATDDFSAASQTVVLTNTDSCRRMYKVKAKANVIAKISQNNLLKSLIAIKYVTRVVGPGAITGSGTVAERAVTMSDGVQVSNEQLVDQRDIEDIVILNAGSSITLEYVSQTVRFENVLADPGVDPNTGFVVTGFVIESFQVRTT